MDPETDADVDARFALQKAFVDGVIEVAKGSVDRARDSAKTVQTAAAAIVTIYTTVLGISFSVTDNPLPSRGLVPAVLLGAAIVLSTVYLAYLSRSDDEPVAPPTLTGTPEEVAVEVARGYILWTQTSALSRRYWIRASVVCLGVSLFFLPAPFVSFQPAKPAVAQTAKAWPGAPKTVSDPALARILYTAQVKEAAALRSKSTAPTQGHDGLWWIAGIIALGLALIAPLVISSIVGEAEGNEDGSKLPGAFFAE